MQHSLFENVPGERFILASGSPRRRELLQGLGLDLEVLPSGVDESLVAGEPREVVEKLAELKANDVATNSPAAWVLAGDTIVVFDGQILGKPVDENDARRMITLLSGNTHSVFGGVSLVNQRKNFYRSFVSETRVSFCKLSTEYIDRYVAAGESLDKAGAYAIQGIGSVLVSEIVGSYTNVIGLDVPRVAPMLLEVGVAQWRSNGGA